MAELDADCRIVAGTGAFNFATIGPVALGAAGPPATGRPSGRRDESVARETARDDHECRKPLCEPGVPARSPSPRRLPTGLY